MRRLETRTKNQTAVVIRLGVHAEAGLANNINGASQRDQSHAVPAKSRLRRIDPHSEKRLRLR